MKWVGILMGIIVFLGIAFFAFNNYIYMQKQGTPNQSADPTTPPASSDALFMVTPISHATMVLTLGDQIVYTDPVGGKEAFASQPAPTIILVSDIHGDHMDKDTLAALITAETIVVMPQAVADMLPNDLPGKKVILNNGDTTSQNGIEIEAIPMYNMPESSTAPHTKGRGNGYVVTAVGKRIYIAGDTSVTPEMKALKNIDVAFVPMNLPYTMSVEEAADGVVAFKPKVVHPYHYRGPNGLNDINKFKELVEAKDPSISVELLNFYPTQ